MSMWDPEPTELFTSITCGNVAYGRELLERRPELIKVSIKERDNWAHVAAWNYQSEIFELLSQYPLDFDAKNAHGSTPLFIAIALRPSVSVVQALLHCGANPNALAEGERPLHSACGSVEICKVLLDHGADPNMFDNWGRTPLRSAALKGSSDVVFTLLEAGADPYLKAHWEHNNAIEDATAAGKHDIVADIEAWLAARRAQEVVTGTSALDDVHQIKPLSL